MSNYTKTTDFEAKDSLPSGDSGKIIRGSEFETEFDNIATAIATKADAASPTFTGTVTIDGLTVNGNTTLGNAATDTVTVTADIASNLIPSADDTYNLGASGAEWNDLFIDGTANIDSLSVGDITGTGDVAIDTNTLFVDVSTDRVGINNASPAKDLDVVGKAIISEGSSGGSAGSDSDTLVVENNGNSGISILSPDSSNAQLRLGDATDASSAFVQYDSSNNLMSVGTTRASGQLRFTTANVGERMRIDASGNVGIGTTSPATALDVNGTITTDSLTSAAGANATDIVSLSGGAAGRTLTVQSYDTTLAGAGFDINASASAGEITLQTNTKDRLRVEPNGDISFYEDTGTTAKLFWDSSAESLGIGNAAPSEALDVVGRMLITQGGGSGGSANTDAKELVIDGAGTTGISILAVDDPLIRFGNATSGSSAIVRYDTSADVFTVGSTKAGAQLKLMGGNGTEAIRIDASAQVGVGTTTPAEALHVAGNIRFGDTAPAELYTNTSELRFGVDKNNDNATSVISFYADNAEKIRMNSSGQLLIGKTTSGDNNEGIQLEQSGRGVFTRDSNVCAFFNRKTNNGDVIRFAKDNVTVGDLGITGDDIIYLSCVEDVGIRLDGDNSNVTPCLSNGNTSDNAIDLGGSSVRWKDLYLSGGVYVGGAVAANLLDDYEEGTWTPELADANTGGNTGTATTLEGAYTKVGRMITVTFRAVDIDTTGMTGSAGLRIRALPFTSGSGIKGIAEGAVRLDNFDVADSTVNLSLQILSGTTYLLVRQTRDNDTDSNVTVGMATSGSADIFGSITYYE